MVSIGFDVELNGAACDGESDMGSEGAESAVSPERFQSRRIVENTSRSLFLDEEKTSA